MLIFSSSASGVLPVLYLQCGDEWWDSQGLGSLKTDGDLHVPRSRGAMVGIWQQRPSVTLGKLLHLLWPRFLDLDNGHGFTVMGISDVCKALSMVLGGHAGS